MNDTQVRQARLEEKAIAEAIALSVAKDRVNSGAVYCRCEAIKAIPSSKSKSGWAFVQVAELDIGDITKDGTVFKNKFERNGLTFEATVKLPPLS